MNEISVLFDGAAPALTSEAPECFRDLNLDQVVEALTAGRQRYDLAPFFYTRLSTVDAVAYRHAVVRDFERDEILRVVVSFGEAMREVGEQLERAASRRYRYERAAWFRDAAETYCDAVRRLATELAATEPDSRGLSGLRDYVEHYVSSPGFEAMAAEAARLKVALEGVRYCMEIEGARIKVSRYEGDEDYSAEVLQTFEKFKQGAATDYRRGFKLRDGLNHVEDAVLERVARLYPEEFEALLVFWTGNVEFVDEVIARFDREIQFYLAYLDLQRRLRSAGLPLCLPHVSDHAKEPRVRDAFDIALANALLTGEDEVVCNDVELYDAERIIVLTGPNQGGKTTFARMVGQLHHLAALGLPVPGASARLYLCDAIYTHFEREEDLATQSGKLEDDLRRIHAVLDRATPDSVVIMNESFTSTTLQDALLLGRTVLQQMIERDLLCVYVTFVDELASLGDTTVSMTSMIVPEEPASRTFKVVRRAADGLAYAAAIAGKYGLTYASAKERLAA